MTAVSVATRHCKKAMKLGISLFRRGFNSSKCKTMTKMAVARIKLLRNKREAVVKQMRHDIAVLLRSGQDATARIRFTPLGRMLYKAPSDGKWGEHELDYLLFIVRDVNVNPNPDEVADVKYVNRDELKELLRKADAGEGALKLSPWFRLVVDNFLLKWWDNVEKGTLQEAADMKTIHKLI
ncbi:hypothetical protein TEA_016241 [Camellia sinensis var. sinensis]|uniref:Uncharacterized protein n=1 Tax=Camellia sinensis var. sinensis TaxID=542762 RepID=A0A4V6RY28_CAMSN|nr:hypothetical protein TEA_016241 [Camellia sinensis var. sinensis]